jgi:hypothetical protein
MTMRVIPTHSSGSGIGAGGLGGGARFLSLSAILAAAFFLSSNILAKSSLLGPDPGVMSCVMAIGGAGAAGREPKPGISWPGIANEGKLTVSVDDAGGAEGGKGGIVGGGAELCWEGGKGGMTGALAGAKVGIG